MKKIFLALSIAILFSCSEDDTSFAPIESTDFTQDFSNLTEFSLSTPIPLKLLEKEFVDDKATYKTGDTLKLEINFRAIHKETITDFYDLYKSTGSQFYTYSINSFSDLNLNKVLDLIFLDKNPEIIRQNLSDFDIRSSPDYKYLFVNVEEILAEYNTETQSYVSKIGIVLTESTSIKTSDIRYSSHVINYTTDKNISISIPIISELDSSDKTIIVE